MIDLSSVKRRLNAYEREPVGGRPVRNLRELPTDPLVDLGVYTESELLAQLHSRNRYPDLPQAIARVLWRQLRRTGVSAHYMRATKAEAPSTTGGAQQNWLLVVVVRVEQKYIVLRLRTRVLTLLGRTQSMYGRTLAVELETLTGLGGAQPEQYTGHGRVARTGLAVFERLVRESGFEHVDDFTAALLQAEAIAWVRDAPARPARVVGQLSQLLRVTCDLADRLGDPAMLAELGEGLAESDADLDALCGDLGALARTATEAGAEVVASAPILANTSNALAGKWQAVLDAREKVRPQVLAARESAEQVRILAALAELLQGVVRHVVKGRITSFAVPAVNTELRVLCDTLAFCVGRRTAADAELRAALDQVSAGLRVLLAGLEDFHRWLSRYRLLVTKAGLWSHFGDFITRLDAHLIGVAGTERLRAVVSRCAGLATADPEVLAASLDDLGAVFDQDFKTLLLRRSS